MKYLLTILLLTLSSLALAERSTIVDGNVVTKSQWLAIMPRVANDYSERLPMTVDSVTLLMSLRAYNDTFTYVYTLDRAGYSKLIHGEDAELTPETIAYGRNVQRKILVNIYCTNPELKSWKALGTKLRHVYSDKVGVHIMTILVDPDLDCQKVIGNV